MQEARERVRAEKVLKGRQGLWPGCQERMWKGGLVSPAVGCGQVLYHTLSEAHPTSPGSPSEHHTLSRRPRTRHSYTEICGDPHMLTLLGQTKEWTAPVRPSAGRAGCMGGEQSSSPRPRWSLEGGLGQTAEYRAGGSSAHRTRPQG